MALGYKVEINEYLVLSVKGFDVFQILIQTIFFGAVLLF